ncbi:MAG: SPASM domain-containing protein [Candidatus Omnitrophica bacterium]|jgi:radical SAM protein with 4Fe4S-binding SPASM domain|nr:SPASM domain-containing protein [Candidatus Omnitrophota bacterium]
MRIDFNRLNEKQQLNLKSALNAYKEGKITSSQNPPVLYIELTQNCISNCAFCKRNWNNNLSYNMNENIFNILLRDYIPFASLVCLNGWGESLILPNLDQYISKVSQYGVKIKLTTTLGCRNQRALQSMVDNDVHISVSFDCADKSLYEKIRKGVSYTTVINNIEFLVNEMKKRGTLKNNLRLLVAPLQNMNLEYLEKIFVFSKDLGISEVAIAPLAASLMNFNLLSYHKYKTMIILQKCARYAKENNIRLQLIACPFKELYFEDKIFNQCCHPWLYIFVNYEGNIIFCDHIIRPSSVKYAIGHISESKDYVWNGEKIKKVRLGHLQSDKKILPEPCRRCCLHGRYADHEHEIYDKFVKWLVTEDNLENIRCR